MNGGILATFEVAYFCGWTVCEETKKLLRPSRPAVSLGDVLNKPQSLSCVCGETCYLRFFVSEPHILLL